MLPWKDEIDEEMEVRHLQSGPGSEGSKQEGSDSCSHLEL